MDEILLGIFLVVFGLVITKALSPKTFDSLISIFKKKERRIDEYVIDPADVENIDAKFKHQVGKYKGQVASLERTLKDKDEEIKNLQARIKGKSSELSDNITKQAEELQKRRASHILPLSNVPMNAKLIGSDNRMLGYFRGFSVSGGERGSIGILSSPSKHSKETYEIWRSNSIERLIRRADTINEQLKNGYLQLTRNWEGDYVPDLSDEIEIPIEYGMVDKIYS